MSVLTVLTHQREAASLASFGLRLAQARGERLTVLCLRSGKATEPLIVTPLDPLHDDADPCLAAAHARLNQQVERAHLRVTEPSPMPEIEIHQVDTPKRLRTVLDHITTCKARVLVAGKQEALKLRPGQATLSRRLFTATPCHTILIRLGEGEPRCRRILVPTLDEDDHGIALRIGEQLARSEPAGQLVPLLVEPTASELAVEVGERRLTRMLRRMGIAASPAVEPRVELDDHAGEAIRRVAEDGFDLMLVEASNISAVRKLLFGMVPDRLLAGADGLSVGVVRPRWSWRDRLHARLGRLLDLSVPQLDRKQRIALYERLESGSRWNFDFMLLIALSTAIATLGLLQDSGAVVIGAMLVAPLMTPILGAGLALVQGNLPLLRTATRALLSGYLLALLIGVVLGLLLPLPELTGQLVARVAPTVLDMGVAFLAGIAAAHCLGRPGLLAALPGVAIAAALVPPIATTGICLAFGELASARGAALLFGTNVVTIILGAAISLYASGLRGKRGAAPQHRWVRLTFLALLLGAVALAFPLSSRLLHQLGMGHPAPAVEALAKDLDQILAAHPGTRRAAIKERPSGIELQLRAPAPLPPALVAALSARIRQHRGAVAVRISTELVVDLPIEPADTKPAEP